jgi:hypothetical protein
LLFAITGIDVAWNTALGGRSLDGNRAVNQSKGRILK